MSTHRVQNASHLPSWSVPQPPICPVFPMIAVDHKPIAQQPLPATHNILRCRNNQEDDAVVGAPRRGPSVTQRVPNDEEEESLEIDVSKSIELSKNRTNTHQTISLTSSEAINEDDD